MRRTIAFALVVAAAGTVAAVASGLQTGSEQSPPPRGNFTFEQAQAFERFTLYWAGPEFERLPMTAILRRAERRRRYESIAANFVSFLYGDCEAHDHLGCALPLEIQNWPICARNPARYFVAPKAPMRGRPLVVRGVPARLYENGQRLEVYTEDTAVILFGEPAQIRRAAEALEPVNRRAEPGQALPPASADALAGRVRC